MGTIKFILFLLSVFCFNHLFSQVSPNGENKHISPPNSAIAIPASSQYFSSEIFFIVSPTSTKWEYLIADTTKKKDRDGDGVVDSLDKCPDEKGIIQYDGCPIPDSDNDGISDDADNCPTVAGTLKYHGCPPPDTDGDKINDDEDKCPSMPGVARYGGCPVGDRDNDGVNDDDDKCIGVRGTVSNRGCPEKENLKTQKSKTKIKKRA